MGILVLILRVGVGGVFLIAGILKAGHPQAFAATIAGFRLLPAFAVAPLALFLPYFEVGLGVYLVLGLFTRVVAVIATLQLLTFAAAVASVVVRGIPIACGCFGEGDRQVASWVDVVRDLALAAAAAAVAWRPPGIASLDARFTPKTSFAEGESTPT